jgi:hypothetical protein
MADSLPTPEPSFNRWSDRRSLECAIIEQKYFLNVRRMNSCGK